MRATFVGLLLVCLIVLLLFTSKTSTKHIKKGMDTVVQAKVLTVGLDMVNIDTALHNYFNEHNEFPATLIELVPEFIASADQLNDFWGNMLQLQRSQENDIYLVSAGPDREFGTADDIKRRIQ